jgi:hypothetical protein
VGGNGGRVRSWSVRPLISVPGQWGATQSFVLLNCASSVESCKACTDFSPHGRRVAEAAQLLTPILLAAIIGTSHMLRRFRFKA